VPTKKPSACLKDIVDDSLIHYQPLELSDIDNPMFRDDISNISNVGKKLAPENRDFSQSYQSNNLESNSFQYLTKSYSPDDQIRVQHHGIQETNLIPVETVQQHFKTSSSFVRSANGQEHQRTSHSSIESRSSSPHRSNRFFSPKIIERPISPTKSVCFMDANASNLTTPKDSPRKGRDSPLNVDKSINKPDLQTGNFDVEEKMSVMTVLTQF
jgi:hypothetical protein